MSAQRAARGLAGDSCWAEAGRSGPDDDVPTMIWGLALGSGKLPYQTAVDVTGPAYRCSCPSRKYPCKHTLGLLLRWSAGALPQAPVPGWVRQWQAERAERAARATARADARTRAGAGASAGDAGANGDDHVDGADGSNGARSGTRSADGGAAGTPGRAAISERTQARRAERVAAGLDELDRWLADQVRAGIARLTKAGYAPWDAAAARLVDAQAPALAGTVRRLAAIAGDPDRLLTELALVKLLIEGFRRLETLPGDLADTVRIRVGMPMPADTVLAGQPPVRDRWHVVGVRLEQEDHLQVRRAWLRGAGTGRPALVLGFAGPGQLLAADPMPGVTLDADLCFYPGAQPLRALIAHRHAPDTPPAVGPVGTTPSGGSVGMSPAGGSTRTSQPGGSAGVALASGLACGPPTGLDIGDALTEYARALAGDPWLERWPMVLAGVVPVASGGRWYVAEADGRALPLDPAGGDPWQLVAVAGGRPVPLSGEWSAAGLRPLAAWPEGRWVGL